MGTLTRPKVIAPFQIARGMEVSLSWNVRRLRRRAGRVIQHFHRGSQATGGSGVTIPGAVAFVQARVRGAHGPLIPALERCEFVPRHRYRDAEAGPRASGPAACGCRTDAVAQIVDEDSSDTVLWTALGHEPLRNGLCQMNDHGLRE